MQAHCSWVLTTHHASTHLNHVHVWLNAHSYSANAHIDSTDTVNQIAFRAMPNHHTHTHTCRLTVHRVMHISHTLCQLSVIAFERKARGTRLNPSGDRKTGTWPGPPPHTHTLIHTDWMTACPLIFQTQCCSDIIIVFLSKQLQNPQSLIPIKPTIIQLLVKKGWRWKGLQKFFLLCLPANK